MYSSGEGQPLVIDNPSGDVPISTKPDDRKFVPTRVVLKLTGLGGLVLLAYFALAAYNRSSVSSFALANDKALINAPKVTDEFTEFFLPGHTFRFPLWGDLVELVIRGGNGKRCGEPHGLSHLVWHRDGSGNKVSQFHLIVYDDFRDEITIQMPVKGASGHVVEFWSQCNMFDTMSLRQGSRGPVRHQFTVPRNKLTKFNIKGNRRALFGKQKSDGIGLMEVVYFEDLKQNALVTMSAFIPVGRQVDETETTYGIRYKHPFSASHSTRWGNGVDLNLYIDQVNTL